MKKKWKLLMLLSIAFALLVPIGAKAASGEKKEPKLGQIRDYQTKNLEFYIIRNYHNPNYKNVKVAIRNNATKVKIPEQVTIKDIKYTVSTVIANATEYNYFFSSEEKELNKDQKQYSQNTKTKEVIIPKTVTTVEPGAFNRFTKLEKITVAKKNKRFKSVKGALLSRDGTKFYAGPTVKSTYSIPKGVKIIEKRAFAYSKIRKVVLPKSCKAIDSRAFYKCVQLKKINLNKVKTLGENVFYKTKVLNVNKLGDITSLK